MRPMPVWRPPTVEIDALEAAVADAARHAVLPLAEIGTPPPGADGVREIRLADGRRVLLALTADPVGAGAQGGRATLEFRLVGQGRIGERVFLVSGRAVLDRATRAFLDLSIALDRG